MKPRILFVLLLTLTAPAVWSQSNGDGVNYAAIYESIRTGDEAAHDGDLQEARTRYEDALTALRTLSSVRPNWNPSVVKFRINDVERKIRRLDAPTAVEPQEPPESASSMESSEAIRTLDSLNQRVQALEAERNELNEKLREALAAKPAPAITPEQVIK